MKIVFVNYHISRRYKSPIDWLHRIKPVVGISEALALKHKIVCIEQINYEGKYRNNGVKYRFILSSFVWKLFPFRIHRIVKKELPDVVIIHGTYYALQTIQMRLMLGNKVKIVVQHHAERPQKNLKKYLQKWASSMVDAYFFPSMDTGKNWIEKGNIVPDKKLFPIMEGSSFFSKTNQHNARLLTACNGQPTFLYVGRLDANKNPLLIVNAFVRLLQINPLAKLYCIYSTKELLQEMQKMIREKDVANNIILVEKIAHAAMEDWYNSADFMISASYKEGTSYVLAEAMSCGCIPILTKIPSFNTMTNNGACGFLYEAGNEQALLSTLLQTNTLNIETEKEKTLLHFHNHLSFSAIANSIENAIEAL